MISEGLWDKWPNLYLVVERGGSPLKTLGSHVPEKFEAYNAHTMARPTKVWNGRVPMTPLQEGIIPL